MSIKIKNVEVYGLEQSLIRSGFPMETGEPNDYPLNDETDFNKSEIRAGKLANTPIGSGHNNFLKGIIVQFDLQYPEYFSPQLQRYNFVDIVSSQSKMHRITSRELTKEDFTIFVDNLFIDRLNSLIYAYNNPNELTLSKSELFKKIISNLPSGYLKWMAISTNYLQLKTIYKQRRNHKLIEWKLFCDWIERLPMADKLIVSNK